MGHDEQVVAVLLLLTLLPIKEYPLPDTVQAPAPAQTSTAASTQSTHPPTGNQDQPSASTSGTSTPSQQGKVTGNGIGKGRTAVEVTEAVEDV